MAFKFDFGMKGNRGFECGFVCLHTFLACYVWYEKDEMEGVVKCVGGFQQINQCKLQTLTKPRYTNLEILLNPQPKTKKNAITRLNAKGSTKTNGSRVGNNGAEPTGTHGNPGTHRNSQEPTGTQVPTGTPELTRT